MFEKIRKPGHSLKQGRLKKFGYYFIFGFICLMFIFLAPIGQGPLGKGIVATVGSQVVRSRHLQRMEEYFRQQYKSRLEQANDESYAKIQEEIRNLAKRELIKTYLLIQGSEQSGFSISDKEIRDDIRDIPLFQENGRFLYARYMQFLQNQNLSPKRFEQDIRHSKLAQNWSRLFSKAIVSNHLEKQKGLQKYKYKVKLHYVELPAEKKKDIESLVTSKDLKGINRFLKKQNKQWEKPKEFFPLAGFGSPITQNEAVMEVLIHYLPQTGLIPRLITDKNKVYILRVLSFQQAKPDKQNQTLESLLNYRFDKSGRVLNSWINLQRQKTKVKLSAN